MAAALLIGCMLTFCRSHPDAGAVVTHIEELWADAVIPCRSHPDTRAVVTHARRRTIEPSLVLPLSPRHPRRCDGNRVATPRLDSEQFGTPR